MQGADIGLSVLGLCGIVIAAIIKAPWRRDGIEEESGGFVCKDVCHVRHDGIDREIAGIRVEQARHQKEISDSLRGIYAKLEALTEMVLRSNKKD